MQANPARSNGLRRSAGNLAKKTIAAIAPTMPTGTLM